MYYQARLLRACFSDLFTRLNEILTRLWYTVLCPPPTPETSPKLKTMQVQGWKEGGREDACAL